MASLQRPTELQQPTGVHGPAEVREAVGVFMDEKSYQAAVDDLLSSGFDHGDISLLAAEPTVQQKLKNSYTQTTDLADDKNAERRGYVATESVGNAKGGLIGGLVYVGALVAAGPVIVTGGTLAAAIAAAVVAGGAGGVLGSVLANWLGRSQSEHLQTQLDNGGLLLWVRTRDADHERTAIDIMKRHSGQDVHLHTLPVDPNAPRVEFQPPLSPH